MRRVIIVSNYAPSAIHFRGFLIADMVAMGYQVLVMAPDWTPDLLKKLRVLGAEGVFIPLTRAGLNPLQDIRTLWALYCYLRCVRPDAVLTHAAKTNVWGMLAAKWADVPRRVAMVEGMGYAFTETGELSIKRRLLAHFLKWLFRLGFYCAHRVVVLNPDDACDLKRLCGVPKEKLVFLGGIGVSLSEWSLHPPHVHPLTFTMVARLLREKGVQEFLAAARQLKAEHPDVRFWLLGPLDDNPGGLKRSDIEPAVREGIVEWPGAVADVRPWLAQTSVFVLPSYREGVPRSTQEAMAMGRPVITTDAPGCRETVVDGVNGFLVQPRNVQALVSAMRRFIENPRLIEAMGIESRRLAEKRFDVRRANAILVQTLGIA